MGVHARPFACHGAVDVIDDDEVGREEDVEVALMDLKDCQHELQVWKGRGEEILMRKRRIGRGEETAYKRRRDRHRAPLVPRLHHRRIDAFDSIGQGVKITCHQPMQGEIGTENIEKLHQSRRYILRHR